MSERLYQPRFRSLTALNYTARGSRHSTAFISTPTTPQALEESRKIHAPDSRQIASLESNSSTTSSSTEKVFLTAPQSPTESVEYSFHPNEHISGFLGPYSAAERPDGEIALNSCHFAIV